MEIFAGQRRNSFPRQKVGEKEKVKLRLKDGKEGGEGRARGIFYEPYIHLPDRPSFTELLPHARHWAQLGGAGGTG